MNRLVNEVVTNNLCTGCGTCAGVCSADALKMTETNYGLLVPKVDIGCCKDCGLCDKICPQINSSTLMKQTVPKFPVGSVCSAFLASSNSSVFSNEGQSGGLVRSLLSFALKEDFAKAAMCVKDNHEHPLRPVVELVTSPDQFTSIARSKYCPVPVNSLIAKLLDFGGPVVFVGLPCHMQGMILAMEHFPQLREKIVLKIGLFCDRILDYRATDFILRSANVTPDEVVKFDYRHNEWKGWPGHSCIITKDGRKINVNRKRRIYARAFFTPIHCRLCVDKLNMLSDISVGDPYGLAKGTSVPTAVLVRNDSAANLLYRAHEKDYISLDPVAENEIVRNQKAHLKFKHNAYYLRLTSRNGFKIPWFGEIPNIVPEGKCPLWVKLSLWFTLFSNTQKGNKLLMAMPLSTISIWHTITCCWQFGLKMTKKVKSLFNGQR